MSLESKFAGSVRIRQPEASTILSRIIYSDSEYGLLLQIQIPDSHMLNVATDERLTSQKRRNLENEIEKSEVASWGF